MTPEELNRTIDFIIQSQARQAAAQEQDRVERLEFQRWSKDLDRRIADMVQTQIQLLEIQSRRLDEESQRTEQQAQRIDQQAQRIDQEAQRIDQEAQRIDQQAQRIDQEARRLDQYEEGQRTAERAAQKRHDELRQDFRELIQGLRADAQKRHEETLAWLQRIVEKISDRLN